MKVKERGVITLFGEMSTNSYIYDDAKILTICHWLSIAKDGFKKAGRRFKDGKDAKMQRSIEEIIGHAVRSAIAGESAENALETAKNAI